MSKIIVIDPGHGGSDPGAQGNGLREKDLTLDISKRIRTYLENNYSGLKVLMTRTNDKYLTLSERAQFANRNKADLFISIHINAGGGTGYESFIHTSQNSNTATGKMQNTVHAEAMKKINVVDRGKKKANFAVLRLTNMRAILPENLFIDRKKEDAAKLKESSELQKIAEGHAIGIAKSLGLKSGKSTSKPAKKTTNKTATSHTKVAKKSKTISQMANEVIAGKHGSGHANRRKSLGISDAQYQKVRAEVNAIVSGKKKKSTTTKTVQKMANEVKKGLHGNGHENRRKSLGISKAKYAEVRRLVNTGIHPSSGKSISQMANEVIAGKHGNGHANRRKSLGISQAQYNKVRAEVNRRA